MPEVIVHEYHWPGGGPLTYEYPIGTPVPAKHMDCLSPLVRDAASQSADLTRDHLASIWDEIHPAIKPVSDLLLAMQIQSVALTESSGDPSQSWIVFRDSNCRRCLLGAPAPLAKEIINAAWLKDVPGLLPLQTYFGNLQYGLIPPCSGFGFGHRLIQESDDQLCWGPTGNWENALPIFGDGCGNTVCVSTKGEIGIWSPHQFQAVAASLAEFVKMFVERQRLGQSPKTEWWW